MRLCVLHRSLIDVIIQYPFSKINTNICIYFVLHYFIIHMDLYLCLIYCVSCVFLFAFTFIIFSTELFLLQFHPTLFQIYLEITQLSRQFGHL